MFVQRVAFGHAVPAVVVGMGLNGLGVVRSLARRGVPVIAVESDVNQSTMRTRYGRKRRVRSLEGDALIDDLAALARELGERPVLFLTQEKSVVTLSEGRDRLAGLYRLAMPDAALVDTLLHKSRFQALAESLGLPIPRAACVQSAADLAKVRALTYPCILKPSVKHYGYGRQFKKAYRVEGPEEVDRLFAMISPVMSDLIVQEWIEGADSDIYFCLQYRGRSGERVASFTGRKLRSWPPRVGGTASCTAAPEASAEITQLTDAFFGPVNFAGLASMEYKRDPRTGRYFLVEPTVCRTDFQEEVADLNGVNIPYAAYLHEIGAPVPPMSETGAPCVWRDGPAERQAAALDPAAGTALPGARTHDALFRIDDPMPWVRDLVDQVCSSAARRLRPKRSTRRPSAEDG